MAKDTKYGLVDLGTASPHEEEQSGWSYWVEYGHWYKAPTVDPIKFGPHEYAMPGKCGMGDCECGCYMGESSSYGPCDPFGMCPENPLPEFKT